MIRELSFKRGPWLGLGPRLGRVRSLAKARDRARARARVRAGGRAWVSFFGVSARARVEARDMDRACVMGDGLALWQRLGLGKGPGLGLWQGLLFGRWLRPGVCVNITIAYSSIVLCSLTGQVVPHYLGVFGNLPLKGTWLCFGCVGSSFLVAG